MHVFVCKGYVRMRLEA